MHFAQRFNPLNSVHHPHLFTVTVVSVFQKASPRKWPYVGENPTEVT